MSDEEKFDILVHGVIGVDYLLQLDGAPAAGETRTIEREVRTIGGGAANCALVLATWGARVCLCGNAPGNDGNGRFVATQLSAAPNLTLHTPLSDNTETPYRVVLAAPGQPHAILLRHSSGVENDEAAEGVTRKRSTLSEAWPYARLAACDDDPNQGTTEMARRMSERGTPFFTRGAIFDETAASLAETVLLSDKFRPQASEEQLKHFAHERVEQCGNTVVIMRGAQGGIWCRAGAAVQSYASLPVGEPDPIGSIGGEDVFYAGLLWSRLQGWSWERGLHFAVVASALKCRQPDGVAPLGQIAAEMGDCGKGY